ncbi:efflux RND transporter periplasmic adaptor subunit [Reinekea thalattae]|uniref:Efflux RND transporter periplasmic adaptor subunit n=1 Tax=Reinekea thalattae TaxID=2593301 RepID=A0A5C8Z7Y1_9GAMM|nr:efflux RND transporter periplasmic adaptor subunit [Reinekea thalattae]TXR53429.1 efflux RND transporter periplasmic adaptor subunit [Reinekea thalattae]
MPKIKSAGPIIAIVISILFVLWMLMGGKKPESVTHLENTHKTIVPSVQAIDSTAREVQQKLTVNGTTKAQQQVTVISEGSGKVTSVLKTQGETVEVGDIIARLDSKDIPAQIEQAKAFEKAAQLEYNGASELKRKGLINEAQIAALYASYQQAKANVISLELQLEHTLLRAPIAGQIENSDLEIGTFIRNGDAVASIYDYRTLVFEGSISEKNIAKLAIGQTAEVELISGDLVDATVSHISSVTNPATRTFDIELEINKVDRKISGVTSTATIHLDNALGHYISPALLYVNNDGQMGLKTLNAENKVQFEEVQIISSDTDGVWVQGLDERSRIIIVGQGFVSLEDTVEPKMVEFNPATAVGL